MSEEAIQRQPVEAADTRWSLAASITAAIGASICCLGPLVLLALGVGGAWASTLTVLDPLRPFAVLVAIAALGFAFYRVYRPAARQACNADGSCTHPRGLRRRRAIVWVAAGLILSLLAAPYILEAALADPGEVAPAPIGTAEVVLHIDGMTCAACSVGIRQALLRVDGVHDARVTWEPPRAVVRYSPEKAAPEAFAEAVTSAGYPARVAPQRP
jgi:mercuric ion transport protein